MRNLIAFILILFLSASAYGQEPFECNNNFHQVFGPIGNSLAYDPDTDETIEAPNNAGFSINAFGYRVEDNFAYGIATGSNTLLRLGSDGVVTSLGAVTGLPNNNFPAGAFADDGLLYVYRGNAPDFNLVYAINVELATVVSVLNVDGPTFSAADIAFNPDDNRFYGVSNVSGDLPEGNLFAFAHHRGIGGNWTN